MRMSGGCGNNHPQKNIIIAVAMVYTIKVAPGDEQEENKK